MKKKKIVLITYHNPLSKEGDTLIKHLSKDFSVDYFFWNEILYFYNGKDKHEVYFIKENKKTKLTDYECAYIRSYNPADMDILNILTRQTVEEKIPLVGINLNPNDKRVTYKGASTQYYNQKLHILFPKTFFGSHKLLLENFEILTKKVGLPFVCKPNSLSKGRGVELIKNKTQLKKYFQNIISTYGKQKSYFLIQNYIKNDGDFRVLVIGDLVRSIKRMSLNKKEFRNNISLGGIGEKRETSKSIQILAKKIKKLTYTDFVGLDYIEHKNKKIFLEVNLIPGLGGVSAAHNEDMFLETVKYLKRKMKK